MRDFELDLFHNGNSNLLDHRNNVDTVTSVNPMSASISYAEARIPALIVTATPECYSTCQLSSHIIMNFFCILIQTLQINSDGNIEHTSVTPTTVISEARFAKSNGW